VNPDPRGVAALAAALLPARAAALLARHPGVDPEAVRSLLAAPRAGRLAELAAALRTPVRAADPARCAEPGDPADPAPAWPVLLAGAMLPFDLAVVSPALGQLDASLLQLGVRAARSAAAGLASVLGGEAAIRGRLLPGLPEPARAALVPIDLTALAGKASLAVECAFASRLAARVAGGTGRTGPAGSLTPAEQAVVELAVLGALDAIASEVAIEGALAPRLAVRGDPPVRPVCIELTVSAAGTQGRAYLFLPEAALRAFPRPDGLPPALQEVPIPGAILAGRAALQPGEVEALQPGDVVLLDSPAGEAATLRLPGGLAARGRLADGSLEVEEVDPPDAGPSTGSAPVLLDVELATVTLPLRELARITPGAVLSLGLDRSGRVTLRIAGRAVARGELVEVDGAVGIRVHSLLEAT